MALLVVAVVAAVVLGARAGDGGGSADGGRVAARADLAGGRAQQPPRTPSTSAGTAGPPTSSSTSTSLAIEIEDEDFTPAKRGAWAQLSDPARSDLGPELARSLSKLGVAVLRADLTGEGRDAFGDYWAGDRRRPCCRRLEVHAAGAGRQPGVEGMARVTVVWSAERAAGAEHLVERTTVVHLAQREGRWVPVHPWEVPG